MAEQEVYARWQDAMTELLDERVPDAGPPLKQVFRLDWRSSALPRLYLWSSSNVSA